MPQQQPLSKMLRQCVLADERTWNKVAVLAGVDRGQLVRFAEGKVTLNLVTVERLCALYGIEHVLRGGSK